jgi:hypothetical protein
VSPLHFTGCSKRKTLFRARIGLHFRHIAKFGKAKVEKRVEKRNKSLFIPELMVIWVIGVLLRIFWLKK